MFAHRTSCSPIDHYEGIFIYVKSKSPTEAQKHLLKIMIRCNLARLMGEKKIKISDLARDTGINRGTLTRLYYETTERVELDVLDKLCVYFSVSVGEFLEHVQGDDVPSKEIAPFEKS